MTLDTSVTSFVFMMWQVFSLYVLAEEGKNMHSLNTFDDVDNKGEVCILSDQSTILTIHYAGTNKDVSYSAFKLPIDAHSIKFAGTLQLRHYRKGVQQAKCDYQLPVVDLSMLTKPLREPAQPWSERLRRMANARSAFEATHPEIMSEIFVSFEEGDKTSQSEISAAHQRLGFALPPEHVDVLCNYGAWQADDSFVVAPHDLGSAYNQMIDLWETPKKAMEQLPATVVELLRASVILYTEVGDGYSALVYKPQRSTGASDGPAFYWISQDEISRPNKLTNRNGSTKDYSQAMLWLIANQVLSRYATSSVESVFVDHHPQAKLAYRLRPELESQGMEFELELEWESFE